MEKLELAKQLAEQNKEKRALWTAFYDQEKSFLHWLNRHALVLLDIKASSPMFDITGIPVEFGYDQLSSGGKALSKPPRFIRKVISFEKKADFDECIKQHDKVRSRYIAAASFMNDKPLSFPQRFPMFYLNSVTQINYTTDDAFNAKILPSEGRIVVYTGNYNVEYRHEILDAFKNAGIGSIAVDVDQWHLSMEASVDALELRKHFGCSPETVIHRRRPTGTQYTCRITHEGVPTRAKFGLIVIPPNSRDCLFFRSPPRKKRLDALDIRGEEISLPIKFNYRLFMTTD